MITIWLIFASILLAGAIALVFKPIFPASLAAYLGLWLLKWSGYVDLPADTMIFWGCATLLVLGLWVMLPRYLSRGTRGRGYIGLGTLCGMVVGMLISSPGIIIGAVVGAILGAMAYVNTPRGRDLPLFSRQWTQLLCGVGLPAVVALSMVGLALFDILAIYAP